MLGLGLSVCDQAELEMDCTPTQAKQSQSLARGSLAFNISFALHASASQNSSSFHQIVFCFGCLISDCNSGFAAAAAAAVVLVVVVVLRLILLALVVVVVMYSVQTGAEDDRVEL